MLLRCLLNSSLSSLPMLYSAYPEQVSLVTVVEALPFSCGIYWPQIAAVKAGTDFHGFSSFCCLTEEELLYFSFNFVLFCFFALAWPSCMP